MVEFRADLHCHSICSDGLDHPLELLRIAKRISLQGISITDHDTTAAYTEELFSLSKELGIRILTGVEISSEYDGTAVHILGYGYHYESPSLMEFLREIQKRRVERNHTILEKLASRRMVIEYEELVASAKQVIGRLHIAALMVKKKYVSSIREAFDRYLKDSACCYASGFKYSPQEVIDQIHLGGGKAVLAHPHFYRDGGFLKKILSFPFDGIECYYASLDRHLEMPWIRLAKEKGWIATGGSDYHGVSNKASLGSSWVQEEVFNLLIQSRVGERDRLSQ